MARPKRTIPKPCLHKPSGQARIYIHGHYVYLGKWGSPEADTKYKKILLEMESVPESMQNVTTGDLVSRFLVWAEQYYRLPNGKASSQFCFYRIAGQRLVSLHGDTRASHFGPLALESVRDEMLSENLCRKTINRYVSLIRTMFKWGVSKELVQETVYRALLSLRGLEEGRTTAHDYPPVESASLANVLKTLEYCHKTLADMIRVQMLCAMRPQEIRLIRSCDIDRSDNDIWVYIPHRHKTQHKKKHRTIPILPEGQAILMPYLIDKERQPEAYLFSPADAMKMIAVEKREKRKSKVQPSQQNRKKGTSQYNDHYTKDAYGTAIERACDRAGVPRWSPNQLRHTRATEVNAKLGIEAARILLGHSDSETTKIYLDSNALLKEQIQRTIENAREIRRVTEQM